MASADNSVVLRCPRYWTIINIVCMFQTVAVEKGPGVALFCPDCQTIGLLLEMLPLLPFYLTNKCTQTHAYSMQTNTNLLLCTFVSRQKSHQGCGFLLYLKPEVMAQLDLNGPHHDQDSEIHMLVNMRLLNMRFYFTVLLLISRSDLSLFPA